mmetsp:Transcript_29043/g.56890  ORF Transcript_29043/g.56890 Transcript_29043/m.56890 type:complete len:229 (-) Transcript_29043:375-1061(-)
MFRPALASDRLALMVFDNCPIVAQQARGNLRISVDFNLMVAKSASLLSMVACVPAALIICPPAPGLISMLWMTDPTGMLFRGRQFPGVMLARSLAMTLSPALMVIGARMYDNTPSSYWMRAMCAERLGSCSILSTVAKISLRALLKSINLRRLIVPPDRCFVVICPVSFLPACWTFMMDSCLITRPCHVLCEAPVRSFSIFTCFAIVNAETTVGAGMGFLGKRVSKSM